MEITEEIKNELFMEFCDMEANEEMCLSKEAFKDAITKALSLCGINKSFKIEQKELEKTIAKSLENNGEWHETFDCVHRIIERRNFDKVAKEVATKIFNVL